MAGNASSSLTLVFLIILIAAPTPSGSFFPSQYRTLVSLGHSLMTRVANLRASRGDHSGAALARAVAARLERGLGLGLWGMMWSTGWDYFRNYAWGEMNWRELNAAVSEMKELLRWVTELTRMNSDAERAAWVGRNYQSVLRVSNSMLGKLLQVFRQSGALREVVETVKKEVVEGGLLRDCLELGSNDLKGLMQVLNDLLSQLSSASASASGHTADL
ncbi:uncharacterized protein LOC117923359 [Vitis riparia]|uniref:Uncharacterized protein n=1 Tax=Vitis vinifera TaxID=29760 RepID=A5BXI5_VITVI|nr:uncharacterized protein LOC117923359 [Vitis riparia]CAN79430.1 hypothetical protein VITISV_001819 [Vitis vinifera]